MGKVIGIDLGTTNSVVAVERNNSVEILENKAGQRITPSVVSFKDGEILIGDVAKRQALTNPDTIISVKRFMGTDKVFNIQGTEYKPEQISAMILAHLKEYAEEKIGEEVTDAVITVPAYFSDQQRQATKDAAKIAGLNVQRIINEPTAAALAYGIANDSKDEIILVYDLGGGTFDVSILQLKDGVFEVLSTAGNNNLGGDDFDQKVIEYIADKFEQDNQVRLQDNEMAMQRLKEEAEKAKKNLSSISETTISLPFITNSEAGEPLHIEEKITREKFEELVKELVESTVEPVSQALEDAGIEESEINEIILVGGSTRIPMVRNLITERFQKEPNVTVNPDEVVAVGAAYQTSLISGSITDIVLLDVTPLTLGVETKGGIMTPLIHRNTTIPASKKLVFTTVEDDQKSVEIKVFQGERIMTIDNNYLGNLVLDEIAPGVAGSAKINVTFNIDDNGILKIVVKDESTGNSKEAILQENINLSDAEIENMVEQSKINKEKDEEQRKIVLLVNIAERKRNILDKEVKLLMTNGVTSQKLAKYIEFVREYDYAIGTRTLESLEKYNKLVNDYFIEIEQLKADSNFEVPTDNDVNSQKEEAKPEEVKAEAKEEAQPVAEEAKEEVSEPVITEAPAEEAKEEVSEPIMTEAPAEEAKEEVSEPVMTEAPAEEANEEVSEPIMTEAPAEEAKEEAKPEEVKAEAKEEAKPEEVKAEAKEETKPVEAKEAKAENEESKEKLERPVSDKAEIFKNKKRTSSSTRVKNEELEILRKELDSLRLKNLELFEEMEDIKKDDTSK